MDLSPDKIWTAKEWENHANHLLRERYTSSNYIPIPDQDRGDGGIEGFSMDGNAYQMYCPENATKMSDLYDKQRNKMTTDIGKFINNKSKMSSFFGDLKIKRWVLVVPAHKTKEMIAHATKKTAEVKAANLSYVNNKNFRVLIWDRNDLKKEESRLLEAGIAILKLDSIHVPDSDLHEYKGESPEFVTNMTRKLSKLNDNPILIKKGKDRLTKSAIICQNMMGELKQDYAEYHEQITNVTVRRAEQLDIEAIDSEPETQKLSYQTKILKEQLISHCKLHTDNIEMISEGTVADWLMNCTLDFN
jgi:hypothetical protein